MNFLYILLALFIFGLLIFIHELGHFIAARLCGVKILEFAIGMGPKIFSHQSKKSGTKYALRLFPIGGFVSMLGENGMEAVQGENGEDPEKEDRVSLINDINDQDSNFLEKEERAEEIAELPPELAKQAYCNQSVWKRILISLAGPLMNILLGFLLMLVIVLMAGHSALGTTNVAAFFVEYTAEKAANGFEPGDTIYTINGVQTISYDFFEETVRTAKGKPIKITVQRLNKEQTAIDLIDLEVSLTEKDLGSFTGSKSEAAGLQIHDEIIKVNSVHVHTYNELHYEISNQGYQAVQLTVLRNGETVVLDNVIFPSYENSGAVFGNVDFRIWREESFDFPTVMKHTFFRSLSAVKTVFDSLFGLFSGRYGVEAVSGPIGIT
ncbi:MAG: site-2 protease family protein, partial [Clostridia bacterium]|nr:site-2 protease family protein [Clostridia bacterium]